MRPALFAFTGCALFAYWALGRPSFEASVSQSQWPTVIWFSATLALLSLALASFGRMVGGRWAGRLAAVAGASLGGASVANSFEDGLDMPSFFALFVLAELIALVSLVGLTGVIAAHRRTSDRLLLCIPGGTVLGLILFVPAGGIIMLVTWLAAAAFAARLGTRPPRSPRHGPQRPA